MTEIVKAELWAANAGHELNLEYPVPSTEELQAHWANYLAGADEVLAAPDVFGAIRYPVERPTAYASVDLCEVVRQTSATLRAVEEQPPRPIECIHCYAGGLAIRNDVVPVIQTLMNHDLVPPTDGIENIAGILRGWRDAGIYVFANTSTLPGCEVGTIRFLDRYLPGAFDGILLPRNHDGSLPLTKGIAARNLLQAFGEGQTGKPTLVIHIDDLTHHNVGFRDAVQQLPDTQVATFQPMYPSCRPADQGSIATATPLEAFEQADAFLRVAIGPSDYRRVQL